MPDFTSIFMLFRSDCFHDLYHYHYPYRRALHIHYELRPVCAYKAWIGGVEPILAPAVLCVHV